MRVVTIGFLIFVVTAQQALAEPSEAEETTTVETSTAPQETEEEAEDFVTLSVDDVKLLQGVAEGRDREEDETSKPKLNRERGIELLQAVAPDTSTEQPPESTEETTTTTEELVEQAEELRQENIGFLSASSAALRAASPIVLLWAAAWA